MFEHFVHHFPVSGVDTYLFLPPLVMFVISSLTSMGGVSGAFILLPFQMSVLGYTAPGVSATNFVYNIVSIPSGVYRHLKERRLSWALFFVLVLGTLPGVFLGYYIRIIYLPAPHRFRFFVGLVLAYLGGKTLQAAYRDLTNASSVETSKGQHKREILREKVGLLQTTIQFENKEHTFSTLLVFSLSLVVGIIGGAYGIGGGAIMAPFCISVLNLPVFVVSGAALFSTWVTSVVAALFYAFIPIGTTVTAAPDWFLGMLFGLGGMAGIYLGARLQKWVPAVIIKIILGVAIAFIAVRYLWPGLQQLLVR
jgi:hypothetical protein